MYKQEEIKPYHEGEKAQQVEQMFDNIAPTYDTLNHRLSWDIDKGWRKKAICQLRKLCRAINSLLYPANTSYRLPITA